MVASLIKENKSLLDSSYELQLRLEESQSRINTLTQDLDAVREESQQGCFDPTLWTPLFR